MGWCRVCGTRRTEDGVCALCVARAARSVCTVCGEPCRGGSLRCPAHSTASATTTDAAGVAGTATLDAGAASVAAAGPGSRRPARWRRTARDIVLVAAAILAFNLAFPWMVGGQRPTVSAATTGAVSGAKPALAPLPRPLAAWDPVDVDLFMRACTRSTPAEVCQCESNGLQSYYTGEQALVYADKQNTRAPLPPHYRDVLVRCSEGS